MKQITSAQKKYLRSQAHHLKPVVQVGKQGLSDEIVEKVDQELNAHELIKVKFLEFHDQKQVFAAELAARTDSVVAGVIGFIAILYREHPDWERREIELPDA